MIKIEDNLTDFDKPESKTRPKMSEWISLGQDHGINVAVWENGITLDKRKKVGENWQTTEKFNLSHHVLKELFVRIPQYFEQTRKKEQK